MSGAPQNMLTVVHSNGQQVFSSQYRRDIVNFLNSDDFRAAGFCALYQNMSAGQIYPQHFNNDGSLVDMGIDKILLG